MAFVTCPDRERIIKAPGHVLVTGGPGCGKTTVALRKALVTITAGLAEHQRVLFLSFSRAAVARIQQAARDGLPRKTREQLEIHTFHSFFWRLIKGHGYLLGAPRPLRLLLPHDERVRRNGSDGDTSEWDAERERLFNSEGLTAFDLFAPKASDLLKRSQSLRQLVASRYPLIIVDEAQDTGTDQWACVELLADRSQIVCLADLDQQIYDFRRDVSPERLKQILQALKPMEVDLGLQNNRSPTAEIVTFGNDILANAPRGSAYGGVFRMNCVPTSAERDRGIRSAVGVLNKRISDATGSPPCSIGYLTNWGKGVSIIARALQGTGIAKEIPHRVVLDEAEVLLATRVIALCLEPMTEPWESLAQGLGLIAELYRVRGGSTNLSKAAQLDRNAIEARQQKLRGTAKCPRQLKGIIDKLAADGLTGDPVRDWLTIRKMFEQSDSKELLRVSGLVLYLKGFNRGRRISDSLAEVWTRKQCYEKAREMIENALTEDQIIGGDGALDGINVMTMHKSKGKEFDGVIILHLGNNMSPLSRDGEAPPHTKSRRLLRVAVTRARHGVLLLEDVFNPSPLLAGHRL